MKIIVMVLTMALACDVMQCCIDGMQPVILGHCLSFLVIVVTSGSGLSKQASKQRTSRTRDKA
jgi:hypothetical protein